MKLARHWSRVASEAVTPAGKRVPFALWRGSSESFAQAEALARDSAERIATRIRRGEGFPERYSYGDRPLREEIVREFARAEDGELEAALTRNVYGALILNTARICFVDVDLPSPQSHGPVRRALDWLLRRPSAPAPDPTAAPLNRLREWVAAHPGSGVRVYRTRSGLRYLVTHAFFAPASEETEAMMRFLGADPQYVRLCRVQNSFRARLSPKPWRCRLATPPSRFPWASPEAERSMRAWETEYARVSEGFATCSLLDVLGSPHAHPVIDPFVRLHDLHTRATSSLPLA